MLSQLHLYRCKASEPLISSKTVAILAPNLMGNICDWIEIKKIADKYNLVVIEDSADTLGAKINGISTGKYDLSITSFYGSHIINCAGNGGALALNNNEHFKNAKLLRSWGRSSSLFDEIVKISRIDSMWSLMVFHTMLNLFSRK